MEVYSRPASIMKEFSKIFKNTAVLYKDSKVEFLYRVGLSVRVDYANSILEVYREEGKVLGDRSSSKGKIFKVKFRGTPTVEGLCGLLNLKLEGSRFTFFTISEIFLKSTRFSVLTEKVRLTEFYLELSSGEVFEIESGKNPEQVGSFEPVKNFKDFLGTFPELWRVVDRHDIPH